MWCLAKRTTLLHSPENLSVLLGWKRGVKVSPAAGIKGLEAAQPPGVHQGGVAGTALSCKYGAFQLCSTKTKQQKKTQNKQANTKKRQKLVKEERGAFLS